MAQGQTLPVPSPMIASCLSCHGDAARANGFADLRPLTSSDIVKAMADYRSGARPATIMNRIAKGYSDAETQEIADALIIYWRSLKP